MLDVLIPPKAMRNSLVFDLNICEAITPACEDPIPGSIPAIIPANQPVNPPLNQSPSTLFDIFCTGIFDFIDKLVNKVDNANKPVNAGNKTCDEEKFVSVIIPKIPDKRNMNKA